MKKILFSIVVFTFLYACSEADNPVKYVFDAKNFEDNIEKYTIGESIDDELGCMFTSMIFTNEVLQAVKDGKEPNLLDGDGTPTTINVYKNKIEWIAIGLETEIINNKVTMDVGGKGDALDLILKINEDEILFRMGDEKLTCDFPFKKIN